MHDRTKNEFRTQTSNYTHKASFLIASCSVKVACYKEMQHQFQLYQRKQKNEAAMYTHKALILIANCCMKFACYKKSNTSSN
jgi:hypothetical protein